VASELIGVAALTKKLRELGLLEDGKAIRRSVAAGGRVVVARAKALIPKGVDAHRTYRGRLVAPGFASRSIRSITTLTKDKQKAAAMIGVRNEAFYAVQFVELGTSKMAKQPWLRPAFESTLDAQQQAVADSLRKTIVKVAKS
jgi:HK97 gp10 family phage protein